MFEGPDMESQESSLETTKKSTYKRKKKIYICAVEGCQPCGKFLFEFPNELCIRDAWIKRARLKKEPRKSSRICDLHFTLKDFQQCLTTRGKPLKRRFLKLGAIPSIFPWSKVFVDQAEMTRLLDMERDRKLEEEAREQERKLKLEMFLEENMKHIKKIKGKKVQPLGTSEHNYHAGVKADSHANAPPIVKQLGRENYLKAEITPVIQDVTVSEAKHIPEECRSLRSVSKKKLKNMQQEAKLLANSKKKIVQYKSKPFRAESQNDLKLSEAETIPILPDLVSDDFEKAPPIVKQLVRENYSKVEVTPFIPDLPVSEVNLIPEEFINLKKDDHEIEIDFDETEDPIQISDRYTEDTNMDTGGSGEVIRILQCELKASQEAKRQLEMKLQTLQKENDILVKGVKRIFNADQIERITDKSKTVKWCKDTLNKAVEMYQLCGGEAYEHLLSLGYPFPKIVEKTKKNE